MKSSDYWMCRFCGHEMDGWYPDEGANQIPIARGEAAIHGEYSVRCVYKGEGIQRQSYIYVDSQTVAAKYPSGRKHHFDSPEVHAALAGDPDD